MSDFLFWMCKPVGEFFGKLLLVFALIFILLFVAGMVELYTYLKQKYCKHEKVRNSRTLDTVCHKCGKNFGFCPEDKL